MKKTIFSKWNEWAGRIGIGFLGIWNRKLIIFPVLVAICLLAWVYHYSTLTLVSLNVALVPTILTLILLLIGLIVVENIESGLIELAEVPRVVTQTLVAVGLVLAVLIYLSGMLFRIFPLPPLPFLFAILVAVEVAPYAVLLVLIPPLVGYIPKIRPKWVALRRRYPFWGIWLGALAGLLTISILVMFPEMFVIGGVGIRIMLMGGSLIICSILLAVAPRKLPEQTADFVTSVLGFAMVFLGVLLWLGAIGGLFFGSIFAILGGSHAHGWKPSQTHPLKAEEEPQKRRGRAARWRG